MVRSAKEGAMSKVEIDANVFLPMPVCIVGSRDGDRENYMAVGWITRVASNPPRLAIGIGKGKLTERVIAATGEFSVNFPASSDLVRTDYVGITSGARTDKSRVFHARYGALAKAPLIEECPLSLGCRVTQSVDLATHTLFIGEIVEALGEERHLLEKGFDFAGAGSFLLTMRDNVYWAFGERLGAAWHDGKAFTPGDS
jgi:flavin reductase (DIM6/NTAB) family NADH-FMN oxidoreductase RutF